jgi:hypothetical protein
MGIEDIRLMNLDSPLPRLRLGETAQTLRQGVLEQGIGFEAIHQDESARRMALPGVIQQFRQVLPDMGPGVKEMGEHDDPLCSGGDGGVDGGTHIRVTELEEGMVHRLTQALPETAGQVGEGLLRS